MRVVIIGCGRVGAQLASLLSLEGREVVMVDRNPLAFEMLAPSFRGERITGFGFDRDVLVSAGIERSDALVSVTNNDNVNIVAALVARNEFHVPKVVTRIYDPERAEIYRRFGIPTISSTTWAANEVLMMLVKEDVHERLCLGNGEVHIVEIEAPPSISGRAIGELTVPGEILVTSIVRQGKGMVPFPGTRFQEGDIVYLAVLNSALTKLKRLLGLT